MASVIVNENNEVLIDNNKALTCEPAKSWFYVTEYDSNGYPSKAKTIGCSGDMPYEYMYGSYGSSYNNVVSRFLQEFEINEGVTNIGGYAFKYSSLKNIVIPNGVTSIGKEAFSYCSSLTSITIPNGVTSIKAHAFYNCRSLTSITIPNSVISIENYAFMWCSSLTSITIPDGVTSIDSGTFNSCKSCLLYDFRGATQVPTLSNVNAFVNTNDNKKIVVPDALYDSWKTATNWSSTEYNIVSSIIKASDYEASL